MRVISEKTYNELFEQAQKELARNEARADAFGQGMLSVLMMLYESNWHTGTPTEEGDYLLIIKAPKGVPHYFANQLNSKGKWRYVYRGNIIAWQKIEPYKENEDGKNS